MKKLRPCVHFSGVYVAAPSAFAHFIAQCIPLSSQHLCSSSLAANMALVCGHCNVLRATQGHWWQDRWFCGAVCSHAAGDRTACFRRNCGCTAYAKKRRWLRAHRAEMRVASDLIADNGLQAELEDRMIRETGNTAFWLGRRAGRAQRRR